MKAHKYPVILESFTIMIILQVVRELAEWFVTPLFPQTLFAAKMITMVMMMLLTVAVLGYAKYRKQAFIVLPQKFSVRYILATCLAIVLYVSAPGNYMDGLPYIMTTVYASIVTPVYEELLFRGYIWGRLEDAIGEEKYVLLWNILLFALWHLGYMMHEIVLGNWFAVLAKIAAATVYGVILGLVRMKTKCCYATMIVHGIMNLFAF